MCGLKHFWVEAFSIKLLLRIEFGWPSRWVVIIKRSACLKAKSAVSNPPLALWNPVMLPLHMLSLTGKFVECSREDIVQENAQPIELLDTLWATGHSMVNKGLMWVFESCCIMQLQNRAVSHIEHIWNAADAADAASQLSSHELCRRYLILKLRDAARFKNPH